MNRRQPSRRKRTKAAGRKPTRKSGAQAIDDTLAELEHLGAASPRAKSLVELFRSWLTEESGYDEETWPQLKRALNRERARVGARRLYDA
jgi:hypothetical protein